MRCIFIISAFLRSIVSYSSRFRGIHILKLVIHGLARVAAVSRKQPTRTMVEPVLHAWEAEFSLRVAVAVQKSPPGMPCEAQSRSHPKPSTWASNYLKRLDGST